METLVGASYKIQFISCISPGFVLALQRLGLMYPETIGLRFTPFKSWGHVSFNLSSDHVAGLLGDLYLIGEYANINSKEKFKTGLG